MESEEVDKRMRAISIIINLQESEKRLRKFNVKAAKKIYNKIVRLKKQYKLKKADIEKVKNTNVI